VRNDGQLVARYPLPEGPLDLSGYVLFTDYLKESDTGTYPAISPADGISRIVGYRRVEGTPFIALASVSMESTLAPFKRNTLITLFFALPAAAALAGALFWIVRLLRLDMRRRLELTDALEVNRLLVRDTHHRVKNNLQAIISLIRMHPLPSELKSDLQGRVAAMSAVHESLYRLDRYAEVSADVLIPDIVESLRAGFGQPATIHYDIEPLVIERDHATPLALLVSEAVTNSLKHAFRGRPSGTIKISLHRQEDGKVAVAVQDDGAGFDHSLSSNGLGTRLIQAMVLQLGGTSTYTVDGGTRFEALLSPDVAHVHKPSTA
jgi:two-component sensor histidine kinase